MANRSARDYDLLMVGRIFVVAAIAMLGGCATDSHVESWRDASETWSRTWCATAKRCDPQGYALDFAGDDACEAAVTLQNCAPHLHDCAAPYDRPVAGLDECADDMATVACGSELPASCLSAMKPD